MAVLSSGGFVGLVANTDEKIQLKMFQAGIADDVDHLKNTVTMHKEILIVSNQ